MGDLTGQVAFVSGASRGIGRALAIGLASHGAHVVGAARTTLDLQILVDEVVIGGGAASAIELDVTRPTMVAAAFEQILQSRGSLDIVVLNAGVFPQPSPVTDSSDADWADTFAVNLFGVVACARAAVPLLTASGGGKIIVIGSGTGHQTFEGLGAYAASKAAVSSLVKTLAAELRSHDIAVNELIPGPVDTQLTGTIATTLSNADTEWRKQPEDVVDLMLLLARFPNNGPSGQTFSLMGRVL